MPLSCVNNIITKAAMNYIFTIPTFNNIISISTFYSIIAISTFYSIIAIPSLKMVGEFISSDLIIILSSDSILDLNMSSNKETPASNPIRGHNF